MDTPTDNGSADLLVIGAGPAGLAAALRAATEGKRVVVLEVRDSIGGAVRTVRKDGFLAEAGPNTLVISDNSLDPLLACAGLAERIIESNPEAKARFIVRKHRLCPVPSSPLGLLGTPLLTPGGKLRLLGDLVRKPTPDPDWISLGGFIEHRFGREPVDRVLNPLIGGIFAGDPYQLALRHSFPQLHNIARRHRSLLLGGLREARRKKRESGPVQRQQRRMVSLPEGLTAIPEAIAAAIGRSGSGSVLLSCRLQRIRRDESGWSVELDSGPRYHAPRLFAACPAHSFSRLPVENAAFEPVGRAFAAVRYPPVTTLSLGFPRQAVRHPLGGFGALVPEREGLSILGVLFASELFPGRAPDGHTLLTIFTGGCRQPEVALLPDPELFATVLSDLKLLLGVEGSPVWQSITRWDAAIPQYDGAFGRALDELERFEQEYPGFRLIGQARDGISLPKSLASGWNTVPCD